jgi:hypothetical protein
MILWRRLDLPGHEAACLELHDREWHLSGTVVVAAADRICRLEYVVVCDSAWRTLWTRVNGWVGPDPVSIRITARPGGRWWVNGAACTALDGCVDVDLGFSPSTNLLPIRRLGLDIGGSASVRAAWLRFPEFILGPLEQSYHRVSEREYRYESDGGRFSAMLEVNDLGMVVRYGKYWTAEAQFTVPVA